MSLLNTLSTGISGLGASELSIGITGHNISNANNEYYTRQRVSTAANTPLHTTPGDIGTGVKVSTISRIHDEFVYSRLKDSSSNLSYDTFTKQSLEEIAKYFPDLQGAGIGKDIQNYFAAWNDFSSNTNDGSQKIALIQNAQTLSTNLKDASNHIKALQDSINSQLKTNVDEMNRIGKEVANLNKSIGRAEVGGQNSANDLRDQRDKLELTLSKLANISVFKGDILSKNIIDANIADKGTKYHINIAGNSFVDGMNFHPIVIDNKSNGSNYFSIYNESQNGNKLDITNKIIGGKVGSMLDLRGRLIDPSQNSGFPQDGTLQKYIDDLDVFAKTFIEQTNSIFAKSAKTSMTSSFLPSLSDEISLTSYSKNIKTGSFDVIVYDKSGNEIAKKAINIDLFTNMNKSSVDILGNSNNNSIVDQFKKITDDNADNNLTNDVNNIFDIFYNYDTTTKKGKLSFKLNSTHSLSGYTMAVDDKGTNFAGVIGLSKFFDGNSTSTMSVMQTYKDNTDKLNGYAPPIDGNNVVANEMIQLQYNKYDFNRKNGATVNENIDGFYRFTTSEIATDAESIGRRHETTQALFNTINSEFQSISGVNIDEELTNLMKFQTAYGANAKVITTIDQMLNTLLGIKQ